MTAKDGKPCKKCGGNKWRANGKCAPCETEYTRQWTKKNTERVAQNQRRWRESNREKVSETRRQWRENNPERNAELVSQWRRDNPERNAELKRQWAKKHPEKVSASTNRRRTLKTAAGGSYTVEEWQSLVEHYGNRCLCCGRTDVKLTADHVVPVYCGGASDIDNIQPLCGACNSSKGTKVIDYRPNKGLGRWIQKKLFG